MPSVTASCHLTVDLPAHAHRSARQRANPLSLVDLLLNHGARVPAGGGAGIVHFTPAARWECAAKMDDGCGVKLRSAHAIVGADGVVTTVGHRFRRVGRR